MIFKYPLPTVRIEHGWWTICVPTVTGLKEFRTYSDPTDLISYFREEGVYEAWTAWRAEEARSHTVAAKES